MTAWEVLEGKGKIGTNVVIAGGGLVGCETAVYLIEKMKVKKVTIVEMLPQIASDVELTNRSAMLERFGTYGKKLVTITNTTVKSVNTTGLGVDQEGKRKMIPADTVVIAMGAEANGELASKLRSEVKQLHVIGDCFKPARIVDAVNHASYIARQI